MLRYLELGMVLVAVIAPQFMLASSVDSDEFIKAGSGAVLGGLVITVYRIWRGETDAPPQTT